MAQFQETRDPLATTVQEYNITRVGSLASEAQTGQTFLHLAVPGVVGQPSIIVLDAVNTSTGAVTSNYLWVDSAGKLRISTSIPTLPDSNGTVVGSQS